MSNLEEHRAMLQEMQKKTVLERTYNLRASQNANIRNLEKAGLTSSPAYQKLINDYGLNPEKPRFNYGGLSLEDLVRQERHMQEFKDFKTSTPSGYKKVAQNMYRNLGIEMPSDMDEAVSQSSKFFKIADRVQQIAYESGRQLQYRHNWTAINEMMLEPEYERMLEDDSLTVEDIAIEVFNRLDSDRRERRRARRRGRQRRGGWGPPLG